MKKYIFILGQASDLAKQEVFSFLELKNQPTTLLGENFIIAESDLNAQELIDNLGGTIKVADYLEEISELNFSAEEFLTWLDLPKQETKINFGASLYHGQRSELKKIQAISLAAKKILKNNDQSARLVSGQEAALSSVIVAKNKLLGREIIFIKHKNKYLIGKTQAVQNFESYGFRDMERPQRDSRSGMLPPKVAQMMLNLNGPERKLSLLDPFCGSGTILQEAALLNFSQIYGQDKSSKAVFDSQENIAWLENNFSLDSQIEISQNNVENLSKNFKHKIDLIVTEPFMGDARLIYRSDDIRFLASEAKKLSNLYLQAFQEFKKICQAKARIVFIFPIFTLDKKRVYTLEEKQIEKTGWKSIKPDFQSSLFSQNNNIIYQRAGQTVLREITCWEKI